MSNPIASYVEKYILNLGAAFSPTVDGEESEDIRANVSEIEGVAVSVSKLRFQNAEVLGDRDPHYKGKKTARKDIQGANTASYDPELAKYCLLEEDIEEESEETDTVDDSLLDEVDSEQSDLSVEKENKIANSKRKHETLKDEPLMKEDNYLRMAEEIEEEESEEEYDEHYSRDEENSEEGSGENGNLSEVDEYEKPTSIKTFNTEDSDCLLKGMAVKNQCTIFDALFETRIGLQKVSSTANQLPQYDTHQDFLKNKNYTQYKSNLLIARKAVKKLIGQILDLQESLLLSNSETSHIITNENKDTNNDSDEITSNDDETSNVKERRERQGNKRKIEDFQETLKKRHRTMIPFRDETLNKWHEKAKLVANQSGGNFSSFEIAPMQRIKNILANKEQLIKRTQMLGMSRGNVYKILGKPEEEEEGSVSAEEYNSEIFDDTDFYSRMLEDVLKSKMSISEDVTEVSRKWIDIQKLRKKAKKNVDDKASKGKKIRFEVMSKLQQFLAPCKPSPMDDDATNRLFSSLFGQSTQNYSNVIIK